MSISKKELVFQLVLLVLVFLFYSFDRENHGFQWRQVAFFANYALAAVTIGYWLMPHFLYKKKYWQFFSGVLLIIIGAILMEELVLELIFYAGSRRARIFPGIYYAPFGIIPIIAILAGFKFGWDALQKQQQIEELKSSVHESELQFLRSQINPHFLFNNLNNLYSYALEGSTKTPEIILELSGILRYILYECKEKFVPLEKEISQLHNFIKLNKLQIEDRGSVAFNIGTINSGYKIAPLILIVFIENAFKHSQAGQTDNIKITIDLHMKTNVLYFSCTNNHKPTQGLDTVAAGIGLKNVKKRLELLYLNNHDLVVRENQETYEVKLSIKLNQIEEGA
ncbi:MULTISPECIES: sensor histidine kinase [Flavobacteriaceae]|uniref:sensor histidine kinase n=1 Tax=Flavobacteriaceae TaxID=49546 RepID=UPI001492ADC6|nr:MULTISPECIES: histidine kinase [Allomuricauda]MDC6366851.1 histidine kinase [Muricauda sp. AC10]